MRLSLSLAQPLVSFQRSALERQALGMVLALAGVFTAVLAGRHGQMAGGDRAGLAGAVRPQFDAGGGLSRRRWAAALVRHAATTPTRLLLIRRGSVTLAAWICYFSAARWLPLGQLVTLYFTAPVVVTILAAPLLGEHVGWVRWLAVGVGFLGTVLAANPAGLSLSPATVLVLIAACLWGYGVILTRKIARREPSLVQMFFNNCFFLVLTAVGCVLTWRWPSGGEIWLLLLVGVLGGLGQFSLFESAQHAPASLTAPLEYTALVWAFLLGFLVWGNIPGPGVFAGAGLILRLVCCFWSKSSKAERKSVLGDSL